MGVVGESFNPTQVKTFKSTNDLSAKQYFAVALDAAVADSIVLANAQTVPTIGILLNAPIAGDTAKVLLFAPTFLAIVGGAVTKGDYLTPDSTGKLIATTSAGENLVGRALETAPNGSGDRIEVMGMGGSRY